jgi:hypothetical protein
MRVSLAHTRRAIPTPGRDINVPVFLLALIHQRSLLVSASDNKVQVAQKESRAWFPRSHSSSN